jgi:hypothetical protein
VRCVLGRNSSIFWTPFLPYLHPAMSLSVQQAKPHHFSHQTGTGCLLFEGPRSLSLGGKEQWREKEIERKRESDNVRDRLRE